MAGDEPVKTNNTTTKGNMKSNQRVVSQVKMSVCGEWYQIEVLVPLCEVLCGQNLPQQKLVLAAVLDGHDNWASDTDDCRGDEYSEQVLVTVIPQANDLLLKWTLMDNEQATLVHCNAAAKKVVSAIKESMECMTKLAADVRALQNAKAI